jgi:uncharacterized membrane protein
MDSLYDWLKFLHVLAAMGWLGGILMLHAVALAARRRGDALGFARSLRFVGPAVLAPSTLAVVAFGIWLVVDSPVWAFDQTWVWAALVLLGATLVDRRRLPQPAGDRGRPRRGRGAGRTAPRPLALGRPRHAAPARGAHLGHGRQARPLAA